MKILICESEEVLLAAIEFRLRKQGFEVSFCKKKSAVKDHLESTQPNLVIIDLDMGKKSGLEVVELVKTNSPATAVLLLAEPEDEEQILTGFELGIQDFLSKPFKPAELIIRVQRIIDLLPKSV